MATFKEWIGNAGHGGLILGTLLGIVGGFLFALAIIFGESNLHWYWTKRVNDPFSFLFYIFMLIVVLLLSPMLGCVLTAMVGYVIGFVVGVVSSPFSLLTRKSQSHR
jgi:hypothetical protein